MQNYNNLQSQTVFLATRLGVAVTHISKAECAPQVLAQTVPPSEAFRSHSVPFRLQPLLSPASTSYPRPLLALSS